MKITLEIPEISPRQWGTTKERALKAVFTASELIETAKKSVLAQTGQGAKITWANLLPDRLKGLVPYGYIPACDPVGFNGEPSTHSVSPLNSERYTHCVLSHRSLLAIAVALEAVCQEPGAIEALVFEAIA